MIELDAIVVGAGFAGLRALHTLRGHGFNVKAIEAGEDVGGVWYYNGYPGARCDVESFDYSYRFSPELEQQWRWTERYATQPEILSYIRHVAERFDLRRDIEFNTRMTRAAYDEKAARWLVETQDGRRWSAHLLVMCVGQLSLPKTPSFPGQDRFRGEIIHSAVWPKRKVDLAGKRVAIIGTGSSGMQMTPVIAKVAKHLTVFQRTANFSVPAANAPVTEEEDQYVKANYKARREQAANSPTGLGFMPNRKSALDEKPEDREKVYEAAYNRWGFGFALAYHDILLNKAANDTAADFIRKKIRERVNDPVVREKLVPKDHAFASRRPSVDSGYFEAFNRDNVTLIDVRADPIAAITPMGIRLKSGRECELDIIVFATGFDAMTGPLLKLNITGAGGHTLAKDWEAGPKTYLGLQVAGFPNLFTITGPGSPSVLCNMPVCIEQHVEWITDCLAHMQAKGVTRIETTEAAMTEWGAEVQRAANATLLPKVPHSWYLGANVEGKPRVFMPYAGGMAHYRGLCDTVAKQGYRGFVMTQTPQQVVG